MMESAVTSDQRRGRLIAVVGPSGVGKDSVMRGLHDATPNLHLVRRVITRAPDLGGEAYDAVSAEDFREMALHGAFAVHWRAHGLHYGIPVTIKYHLSRGTDCLANFSRTALAEASTVIASMVALNLTARSDTLAERLSARGREDRGAIARRLSEAEKPLPSGLEVITVPNDGSLDQTVARASALLQQSRVALESAP